MSFAEIDSPDHDKGKAGIQAGPHGINSESATDNKKNYDGPVRGILVRRGFWSGQTKSPGSGQIKRSGPGILVRALKSLSSFVYQRPCMFQHAACTPGLPDEAK